MLIYSITIILFVFYLSFANGAITGEASGNDVGLETESETMFDFESEIGRKFYELLHSFLNNLLLKNDENKLAETMRVMKRLIEEKVSRNELDTDAILLTLERFNTPPRFQKFLIDMVRLFARNRVREGGDQNRYHCFENDKHHNSVFSAEHCVAYTLDVLRNFSTIDCSFSLRGYTGNCLTMKKIDNIERLMEATNQIKSDCFWKTLSLSMKNLYETNDDLKYVIENFKHFILYSLTDASGMSEFAQRFMYLKYLLDSKIWSESGVVGHEARGKKAIKLFTAMLSLREDQYFQALHLIQNLFTNNTREENESVLIKLLLYSDAINIELFWEKFYGGKPGRITGKLLKTNKIIKV